jgi:hypothetical protein
MLGPLFISIFKSMKTHNVTTVYTRLSVILTTQKAYPHLLAIDVCAAHSHVSNVTLQ